jgi:hypothetical protein
MKYGFVVLICIFMCCQFVSCKKESFIESSNAQLLLTQDSLKFDTVFTSTGSVTQSFKIINQNNQKIRLSSVKLMGGNSSSYNMNVNGVPTDEAANIEMAANDSIYVFVSVSIDPNTNQLPFVVSDSIRISYNGNERWVQLQAFGQNAHFLRNQTIISNTTWPDDLPYVILDGLTIASNATLTIDAGCNIYAHANAPILVNGKLIVNGQKNNEVIFTGDRLDADYRDLPASWPGIYFGTGSAENRLTFAVIKNATQAIVTEGLPTAPQHKLLIQQCIIDNAYREGILSIQSKLEAENTLISNCGGNINIVYGGEYLFTNCTIASYTTRFLLHTNPVLQAFNYNIDNGNIVSADLQAVFRNCIFWGDGGSVDNEVVVGKEGTNSFNVDFENCLMKILNDPSNSTLSNIIRNETPLFDSIDVTNNYFDFRQRNFSFAPGIDAGSSVTIPFDLDNEPRLAGIAPDLGCYERQ